MPTEEGIEYDSKPAREMPRYQSHKKVWALKIKAIEATTAGALITPEDEEFAPLAVDSAYVEKHAPQVGGYYVVYEGGYKSWSPGDAFEGGYTRCDQQPAKEPDPAAAAARSDDPD